MNPLLKAKIQKIQRKRNAMRAKNKQNTESEVKSALDEAATRHGAYARPTAIDVVFKPWKEWHALTEDLKEARRLLRMVLEADGKNKIIDVGQIIWFLDGR